ncbi:hypothetical protein L3Q72_09350 [Vibrio sp. JC009]|nr:hypothetical protein [Vibrio sp. JC009]WED20849.1 hypothetical protein L3Q72_09350 [Vibrio sp. JC009]
MPVNKDLNKALKSWNKRELTEFSEAPLLVRISGLIIVSISAVLALI